MRKITSITLCIMFVLLLSLSTWAGPVYWISENDGDWTSAANWSSCPFMPGILDDVILDAPGILNVSYPRGDNVVNSLYCTENFSLLNGSLTVASPSTFARGITFSGGTLGAQGIIDWLGNSTWYSGTITGWGGVNNAGVLVADTPGNHLIDGGLLSNTGTLNCITSLMLNNGSLLDNKPGGIIDLGKSGAINEQQARNSVVNNSGTLRKSGPDGVGYINVGFNNTGGNLEVLAGTLNIAYGGNHTDGKISIAANSMLNLVGNHTFAGAMTASGAGTLNIGTGSFVLLPSSSLLSDLTGIGLQLATQTIDVGGKLTNAGNASWTNGIIKGRGSFENNGLLKIDAGGSKQLDGINFNNSGVISHISDTINFANSARINNLPDGLYDLHSGAFSYTSPYTGQFNNYGAFRKSSSTTISSLAIPFNNIGGSIEVQTGTLQLASGGTSNDGAIYVNTGATLTLGQTHTYSGELYASGPGILAVNGTLNAVPGADIVLDMSDKGLTLYGGGKLVADGTINNIGNCDLTGGTITGWGGLVNTGSLTVNTAGTTLDNARLDNSGTVSMANGQIYIPTSAVINNLGGGLCDISSYTPFGVQSPASAIFNNYGTLRQSINPATNFYLPICNIGGIIDVSGGLLKFTNGGSFDGGTISIAKKCGLDLLNNYTVNGRVSASGMGWAVLENGTFTINDGGSLDVNLPDPGLTLGTGNTVVANGLINNSGALTWSGGKIKGRGGLNNTGTVAIKNGNGSLDCGVLNNSGTLTQDVTLLLANASSVNNAPNGLYILNGVIYSTTGPTGGTVTNSGILRLVSTISPHLVSVPFNNNGGTIEVGTQRLALSGGGRYSGGTITMAGGTLEHSQSWRCAGNLYVSGDGAIKIMGTWVNDPRSSITIDAANAVSPSLQVAGGSFGGNGTVFAGSGYSQGAGSTYRTDLYGVTDYGRLAVNGKATLAGTLLVTFGGGYTPSEGDSFDVITCTSREGSFQTLQAPAMPEGLELKVEYTDSAVRLVVVAKDPGKSLPSVASAKSETLGTRVSVSGVVTAVFSDCFYIEDENRIGGIRVQGPAAPNPQQPKPMLKTVALVDGTLDLVNGNLSLTDAEWIVPLDSIRQINPWAVTQKALGGAANGLQPGVFGGYGLSNVGLLVTITGKVTYADSTAGIYYVDDGSSLSDGNTLAQDGSSVRGVKILAGVAGTPDAGTRVIVTGICVVENTGTDLVRVIRETTHQ